MRTTVTLLSIPLLLTLCGKVAAISNCPDLLSIRSDFVKNSYEIEKSLGFWYEIAYKDLSQIGESCQYYNRPQVNESSIKTEGGFREEFGFTYLENIASHINLFYESEDDAGFFEKYLVQTPAATFPFVVVDVGVNETTSAEQSYDSLIEYSCSKIGPVIYEEIRIGARTPDIPEESLNEMLSILEDAGIDTNGIKYVEHTPECQYK